MHWPPPPNGNLLLPRALGYAPSVSSVSALAICVGDDCSCSNVDRRRETAEPVDLSRTTPLGLGMDAGSGRMRLAVAHTPSGFRSAT